MAWAFARCKCGDVIELYARHNLHLGQVGTGAMLETALDDAEHQPLYELVERRLYLRPLPGEPKG